MTHYLAANGHPFTDQDAASVKAERMSAESGEPFDVIAVEGGFVIESSVATAPGPPGLALPTNHAAQAVVDQPFVVSLRPAWRAQIIGFFVGFLGMLLLIAPTWPIALFSMGAVVSVNERMPGLWDDIALLGIALFVIGLGTVLWRRYYQKSVITNQGVMQSVGIIISRRVSQVAMTNIHVVDVKQPNLIYMLMNLGTIELSTPGSSGADVAIVDVVSPKRVAAFIRERIERARLQRQDNSSSQRNPS